MNFVYNKIFQKYQIAKILGRYSLPYIIGFIATHIDSKHGD